MNVRLTRDDALFPNLEPGHHAYRITDAADRLRGAVASASSSRGRQWWAFRVHPNRRQRWVPVAQASTREAAVHALVDGRP